MNNLDDITKQLIINRVYFLFVRMHRFFVYFGYDHRVIILLERACLHNKIGRKWCKLPDQNVQRHSVTSLETACSLANDPSWGGGGCGRSMYSVFPGNCSVSYLSFVYGRSLWAELNGGENSLHWKANMLPLFSIMFVDTIDVLHLVYSNWYEN